MNEKLREVIFQGIGNASMLWSEIPKGVFESYKALELGDELVMKTKHIVLESLLEEVRGMKEIDV